ncbi:MAG TPA: methyltransferase domain-containing protein [Gaiellaceae bacterium]|jgi:SAM-dependent methyltransferase|nr:methyltransferase domain-containing protein [Gaiellaceae bacterium]
MNVTLPALRPPSVHRVPRARLVDRLDELRRLTRGRRVIDLGFVDEGQMESKGSRGSWLHAVLATEARELVGVDADAGGVERARAHGYEAYAADVESRAEIGDLDLEPADAVVAGELVEHLDRPGDFLEAVKPLVAADGVLVLTTPNAHSLTNVLGAFAGRELVNPDHVAWLSWRTLATLLGRHGWTVEALAYYRFPRVQGGALPPRLLFNGYQTAALPLFHWRPNLADGILVVARLA